MVDNADKFKELVNDCDISNAKLETIFKKYELHDVYKDEILEDDFIVSSESDFVAGILSGNIKTITDDMIQYITLSGFYATYDHEFILDAYYSKHQFLDVVLIDHYNRAWVFEYLKKNNKNESITYGLDQNWDVNRLFNTDIDENFDFKNWDPRKNMAMSVFTLYPELRIKLFKHICNMYKMDLIGDEFYPVLQEILINHNGFELLNTANQYGDDILIKIIEDIVNNEELKSISVMKTLSEFYIEDDHIVYMLVTNMQNSQFNWPTEYVNFESIVRYVKTANMKNRMDKTKSNAVEYQQESLDYFSKVYLNNLTNINDLKLAFEFTHDQYFTIPPLMYRFTHFINRFENTGQFDPKDLLKCEIQKPDHYAFIEFMLEHMTDEQIEILIKEDTFFEFDVFRNKRLRRANNVELITKFPDLIVYFAA